MTGAAWRASLCRCWLIAVLYPARNRCKVPADYPWGETGLTNQEVLDSINTNWGTAWSIEQRAASMANDERFRHWYATLYRLGASPGAAMTLYKMNAEIDVRHVLPTIRVPTLILHRTGDRTIPLAHGRYLAAHIPGAKFVELEGIDHVPFVGDADSVIAQLEEFLTGVRPLPEPDRVLSTVLFTDIVNSTNRLSEIGDKRWRELLENHNALIRRELARYRGREVSTAGDSFLATFDGPARAVRCALSAGEAVRQLGMQIRAGLHTGEIELMGENVGGMAVHIGARVAALAGANEVLVSSTVKDLVAGSGLQFADRGSHVLKGVPGEWHLFAVER